MIGSFRDANTEKIWNQERTKRFSAVAEKALRKLIQINQASTLQDLKAVPGNRFEALTGDRKGQYSIRINEKYRVCFEWMEPDAYQVEIVDYH